MDISLTWLLGLAESSFVTNTRGRQMPQQLLRIQEVILAQLLCDRDCLPALRVRPARLNLLIATLRRHRHAFWVDLVLGLVNDGLRRLPRAPASWHGDL